MSTDAAERIPSIQAGADVDAFQGTRVATISLAHLVHDFFNSFLAPLLVTFTAALGLSKMQAGALMIFLQVPSVLQPVIGNISDRVNLCGMVVLGPALTAILITLTGLAPNYPVIVILLLIAGIVTAAFHAVASALSGNLSGRRLGRGIGVWMVGGEFGYALGPILVVSFMNVAGVRNLLWLSLIGIATSVFLYFRLRDISTCAWTPPELGSWKEAFRRMSPVLFPLIGITFLRSFLIGGLSTYLPMFITEEGGSLWLAGVSLSIVQVAGMLGVLSMGTVSDRIGRGRTIALSLALSAALMIAFLSVHGWLQIPVLIVLGFISFSVQVVLIALVQATFRENRAFANGFYVGGHFVVFALAVTLMGALADAVGLRTAFFASSGLTLLAIPLLLLIPRNSLTRTAGGI